MQEAAIEAIDLSFKYRTETVETTAVDNVALQVACGEYLTIQGPSGCGKSTLLALFALVERPYSGRLQLMGSNLTDANEEEMARFRAREIGMVFQDFHLIPELSILENLLLKLKYRDRKTMAEHSRLAEQTLKQLGLEQRGGHYPNELSGGQQQRAAIARAIVGKPRLLLADEPTGNLDSANSRQVMEIFDAIHASGVTVVMVTHNPAHAARGTRAISMKDGRIQE